MPLANKIYNTMKFYSSLLLLVPFCSIINAQLKKCVLLGDSYSSGNGAEGTGFFGQGSEFCGRSPHNWGQVYANLTGCTEYFNRACGAAKIVDIQNPRSWGLGRRLIFAGQSCPTATEPDAMWVRSPCNWLFPVVASCKRIVQPQIDAVTEDTDYVLMTMGANDFGFAKLVLKCFTAHASPILCRNQLARSLNQLPQVEEDLRDAVRNIQDKLAGGQVVLVHYPLVFQDVGYTLRRLWITVQADRQFREGISLLNEAITRVAVDTGALLYANTAQLFDGHEANPFPNRVNDKAWIGEDSIHPNTEGYLEWGTAMATEGFT